MYLIAMKRIVFILPFFILFFTSCKVKYASKQFDEKSVSIAPSYNNVEHWAVLPNKIPSQLESFMNSKNKPLNADVFFVYPTLLVDKKNDAWNADITDSLFNKKILDKSIHFQASAWVGIGRLFVPYYRQSHYRIYVEHYIKQSGSSYEIAFNDIKKAFEYYLKHYNKGRPIIIASHSQGSAHCKRLLREYFDGTQLQQQLVAAYVPGIRFKEDTFKFLKPMISPNETGGYVCWNSYKWNKYPKKYKSLFQGGVTSNPITWNSEKITNLQNHKGVLYSNNKMYPHSLKVEVKDGILWVSLPKVPKRFFMRFIKNYHFADINFFWEDIRINAQLRVDAFLKLKE